jgi:hypothetical protein
MTSNDGGYQGGQYGGQPPGPEQPGQGWNAPPAPPAQYPGYAPAPSAPSGYGAPQPLERPVAVRAGLGAFIATMVLGVVGSIIVFSQFDDLLQAALVAEGVDAELGSLGEDVARTALVAGIVFSLILLALQAMFIWFAWNGRNWARIVLWVLGGLGVASGLVAFAQPQPGYPGYLTGLNVFTLLLTIAGIVLLAQKPANEWYRYRGWLRATGQGR